MPGVCKAVFARGAGGTQEVWKACSVSCIVADRSTFLPCSSKGVTARRPAVEIERSVGGQLQRRCLGCGEWKTVKAFSPHGMYLRSKCRPCAALEKAGYKAKKKAATGRAAAVKAA